MKAFSPVRITKILKKEPTNAGVDVKVRKENISSLLVSVKAGVSTTEIRVDAPIENKLEIELPII